MPHPTSERRPPVALYLCLCLAGLVACSTFSGEPEPEAPASPPAALVDGVPITVSEVDEQIRQDLFDREFTGGRKKSELYDARRSMVEELIAGRLLDRAAAAAGQEPEAWLDAAVAELPPVTDAEVEQLFEANRARLPEGAALATYEPQLRAHLYGQRREQVIEGLRAAARVEIRLPRERFVVEAVGPSVGPASAPITIVEFSDFQCPYCARAVPTLETLRERYPDDVRIVYRHLPLGFHKQARIAALASVCADAQGHFWAYHDVLFENQQALERDDLIGHAAGLGLDAAAFEACLDAPETAAAVDADVEAARTAGATGTPTFFVNGVKLTGARPIEDFEALLAEERAALARP